jgi:hypothetical protein
MADKSYDSEQVQAWSRVVDDLDGYIFVTPEYNHLEAHELELGTALGLGVAQDPLAHGGADLLVTDASQRVIRSTR